MYFLFYNFAVRSFYFLIWIASFKSSKARKWIEGRKAIFSRLKHAFAQNSSPIYWFHTASLGEFEQGRPVMEKLRKDTVDGKPVKILLTFFSPSGFEVRKDYEGADFIFYLPLDTTSNARQFLEIVRPKAVFFVKYEFWYHYLVQTHQQNIPLFLFSAVFRPDQIFFKWYGMLHQTMLKTFTHIFVQNEASKLLLQKIGITNVSIAGDTRFDRVIANRAQAKEISIAKDFKNDIPLLVVGSCWGKDLDILLPMVNIFSKPLKIIIAPHEIKESTLQRIQKEVEKPCIRFSTVLQNPTINLKSYDVLLIDNVGMLASLYQYADFAYIGGAFGEGLHNILEPAVFGAPVLFGKDYRKFPEAYHLIAEGGAFSVKDLEELKAIFDNLYENNAFRREVGEKAEHFILQNRGGADKICQYFYALQIEHLIKK